MSSASFNMANNNAPGEWLPNLTSFCATVPDPAQCVKTGGDVSGLVDYHFKTKFMAHTSVMYRIKIEGYSFDQSKPISSEAVGYLFKDILPEHAKIVNGNGLGAISASSPYDGLIQEQYISKDNYLVIRMTAGLYCTSIVLTANAHYGGTANGTIEGTQIWIASANSAERL
jgi:hypothetical protein